MVRVLTQAEVGDQHRLAAEGVAQPAQRLLHDASVVPGLAAVRVLGRRDAEQDEALHPQPQGRLHFACQ